MPRRWLWCAAFAVHFMFIVAVCSRDIVELIASGGTILPQNVSHLAANFASVTKAVSQQLPRSNALRQIILCYCHVAGIESPYSFFAPTVPDSIKVTFEITSADKEVSYEPLRSKSMAEDLRLSALVDQAALNSGPWREVVLQMLAASAADENPEAKKIRVNLAALKFPSPSQYLKGVQPHYQFVCSYDFIPEEARR